MFTKNLRNNSIDTCRLGTNNVTGLDRIDFSPPNSSQSHSCTGTFGIYSGLEGSGSAGSSALLNLITLTVSVHRIYRWENICAFLRTTPVGRQKMPSSRQSRICRSTAVLTASSSTPTAARQYRVAADEY